MIILALLLYFSCPSYYLASPVITWHPDIFGKGKLKEAIVKRYISIEEIGKKTIKESFIIGDFKIKSQYQEHDVLRSCTEVPILAKPDHPIKSILIDDSYLFVGIYSDAVGKAILEIDPRIDNVNIKITDMLINKIISEQTLNRWIIFHYFSEIIHIKQQLE